MPIDTTTGAHSAQRALTSIDGQPTGVVHESDFAVCGDVDVTKQVRFDCSRIDTGTALTLDPTGIVSSSIEIQLSMHAGASTTVAVTDTITNEPTVTMRLRKVGDVVFCQINAFAAASFEGTTGQSIKTQAEAIPAEYRPSDDYQTFPSVCLNPSQFNCWAPFYDGHLEFFKDATYDGFANGAALQFITVTGSWCTADNDA